MKAFYETRKDTSFVGLMTNYPFPLHVHEIVELVVVTQGRCVIQLDGKTYTLSSGDAAIAFPLSPHSYDEIDTDTQGLAAFFSADTFAEYSNTFHTLLPEQPIVRGMLSEGDAALAVERLLSIPDSEESPFRSPYLHLLLAHILNKLHFCPAVDNKERGLGARAVRFVYSHACENITISSTARQLGISESHLSHLFAKQLRVNFRSFVNAIRIDKAAMLMRDPYLTLTQICFQCGFENMRTFRRAFVKENGTLPAVYARAVRAGAYKKQN